MTETELARLAGITIMEPDDGQRRADALVTAVQTAADRGEAADAMAAVLGDQEAVAAMGALLRQDAGAWSASLAKLRAVRGISDDVRALDKLVRRSCSPVRVAGPREGIEAPDGVPDGYQIPPLWHMDVAGICAVKTEEGGEVLTRITTAPIWVIGRMVDVDTGAHALELAWPGWAGQQLIRVVVDGRQAADSRAIVALADQGAPITSANARDMVRFIDASRAANEERLPVRSTAQRMGWMRGGFLLGDRWIGEQESAVALRVDDGAAQVAAGITCHGTWERWLGALEIIRDQPSPWVALYLSVASVLLYPLDAHEGICIDWSGETSRGKTSSLRLGASVWGEPSPRGLLQSWDLTAARAEGIAALVCHIPWFLDDTKRARRPGDVADLVYMQAFGQGRGRAKPDGLRSSASWLNALGSSGEQALTSFSQDAGARARTLCMVGSPLASRELADRLNSIVLDNYGHLGMRVVTAIIRVGSGQIKGAWKRMHAWWVARLAPHGAVAGRLAALCAHLEVAAWLLHVEMGIAAPHCDVLAALEAAAITGGRDSDRPAEALRMIYEIAMAQSDRLWARGHESTPQGGWIGAWDRAEMWAYLAIRPQWAREQLERAGFDGGVVDRWGERGWLQRGSAAHNWTMATGCGEARPRLYRITRQGLTDCGAIG